MTIDVRLEPPDRQSCWITHSYCMAVLQCFRPFKLGLSVHNLSGHGNDLLKLIFKAFQRRLYLHGSPASTCSIRYPCHIPFSPNYQTAPLATADRTHLARSGALYRDPFVAWRNQTLSRRLITGLSEGSDWRNEALLSPAAALIGLLLLPSSTFCSSSQIRHGY